MNIRRVLYGIVVVLTLLLLLSTVLFARSYALPGTTAIAPVAAPLRIQAGPVTTEQSALQELLPTQEAMSQLYATVAPSVVNIQVTLAPRAQEVPVPSFPFDRPGPSQPQRSEGSGFIYDTAGHIVTNNHVVENAQEIFVTFGNGMWAKAELVARDPQADLAVIKVDVPKGLDWQPLKLAPANNLRVGYYVAALGSPFGLDETMTVGIVSALGRSFPVGSSPDGAAHYSLSDIIQTDAAINPGNSGGPLLDLNGDVVGVNFAINSPVRANAGVGFAIPVSVMDQVVPALIKDGAYHYAYLGLSGQTITAPLAEQEQIEGTVLGVYVGDVTKSGSAAEAGIKTKDIVVGIDDQPVARFEDISSYLFNATTPGQTVTLHLLREGKALDVKVKLSERPTEAIQPAEMNGRAPISVAEAITVAKQAVVDSGQFTAIDSASARRETQDDRPVWVVNLKGEGKSATVTVDGLTGEVLALDTQ